MKKTLFLLLNLLTIPACFCMDSSYGVSTITEKQRQEIEKERSGTLFIRAIINKDLQTFDTLLADVDPEVKVYALKRALYETHKDKSTSYVITKLLEANVDIKKAGNSIHHQDGFGITPLHFAVNNKNVILVKALLEAGVDITICTPYGETALQLAEKNGCTEIVELLKPKP